MNGSDSTETGEEIGERTARSPDPARDPVKPGASEAASEPERPSAIERQMAAAALLKAKSETERKRTRKKREERDDESSEETARAPRFVGGVIVVLLLSALVGALYMFPQLQRLPQAAFQAVEQEIDRIVAIYTPLPVTMPQPAAKPEPSPQRAAPAKTPEAPRAAEVAPSNALSVPMQNITLRHTPELLEQLVAVYRSQLFNDPHNAAALNALGRLREQSLAELEAISAEDISAEKDAVRSATSLEIISRLFPELLENDRYHSSAARIQQSLRNITGPASPAPADTRLAAPVESPPAAPAAKPEKAVSSKPDVRVLSVTPGKMAAGQFVPEDGGNVFMVVINYRNFVRHRDAESESELVVRLGNAGDQQVLAEAAIDMHGDRGTRSVPIETFIQGYGGEAYKLNFILDGEFLAARRVRLSAP